ncbi:hypothetical protein SAMN04489832_6281 [Micromonospora cremea]|uniref:Uncharacterized protein n=1 Tax=Micromonospora cremea TaxID=709881 RepID=A0A1N6AWS3_9ACTN|nr:hypothetical protein SAMN04489832_6281 [Micromonospora cremea]
MVAVTGWSFDPTGPIDDVREALLGIVRRVARA